LTVVRRLLGSAVTTSFEFGNYWKRWDSVRSYSLENKSGRRGSNPRRPAWEIGQQLKTKTHHVYGVHSEPPKTQQNHHRRSNLVLTRQECGRTFGKPFRSDSHRFKLAFIAKRVSKPLKSAFNPTICPSDRIQKQFALIGL
jgi:hypothetical protein